MSLRRLLVLAAALAIPFTGLSTPLAQADSATATVQANLAGLAYLPPQAVTGRSSAATTRAIRTFQQHRCLDAVGNAGSRTRAQLDAQTSAVQKVVGARVDGASDADTRRRTAAWQKRHGLRADGRADAATLKAMGLHRDRACGRGVVGNIRAASDRVACAPGTRNLGVHTGYAAGRPVRIRLCAIPGLRSSSSESVPGSRYYVRGANGDAIVNSRASSAYLGLVRVAGNSGRTLRANSSFRTMAHQRDLCRGNAACRRGTYTWVMRPGWSNHQLGAAVDFAGTHTKGSCSRPARQPSSATWGFLQRNAGRFGIRQYQPESWHWEAAPSPCR
ncbi:peptidoglycan-binding protein [Luteococcus peritonei]|uniref:Peptidoglycan-binding protein n=1 Tax=Luteococcus peritonei TaxID=88874 RepID=A0ABW4RY22_9ACTN